MANAARMRHWPLGLILLTGALVFSANLSQPAGLVFDEAHYVPAARALAALEVNSNVEHPLLAKQLIALGMRVAGDGPLGWRLFGPVMALGVLVSLYSIAWMLLRCRAAAVLAAGSALFNQILLVQARTAMLDIYMAGFFFTGLACLLWSAQGQKAWGRLALAGVCLGAAAASKWAVIPYILFIIPVILCVRGCEALHQRRMGQILLSAKGWTYWPGLSLLAGAAILIFSSALIYFASFWPMLFLEQGRLDIWGLFGFQITMLERQLAPLGPHPDISHWWQWLLPVRPQWYWFDDMDGVRRALLLVGNPVVIWGGALVVLAGMIGGIWRRDWRLLTYSAIFLAAYGLWPMIPKKIAFYYYFFLPALFLSLSMAGVFHRLTPQHGPWPWAATAGVLLPSVILCAYFWPVLTAQSIGLGNEWLRWAWFPGWRGG